MEDRILILEKEIKSLQNRNQQVEMNKAWETSATRKIIIIIFTYLAISLFLNTINIEHPWLNAIVPATAFLLSTLTLPFFKNLWLKYIYKNKRTM